MPECATKLRWLSQFIVVFASLPALRMSPCDIIIIIIIIIHFFALIELFRVFCALVTVLLLFIVKLLDWLQSSTLQPRH